MVITFRLDPAIPLSFASASYAPCIRAYTSLFEYQSFQKSSPALSYYVAVPVGVKCYSAPSRRFSKPACAVARISYLPKSCVPLIMDLPKVSITLNSRRAQSYAMIFQQSSPSTKTIFSISLQIFT